MTGRALFVWASLAACQPRDPRCEIDVDEGDHIGECTIGGPFPWYAYSAEYDQCFTPIGCWCDEVCESWELFETLEECEQACVEPWP